jgi:hypothetical protein
VRVKVKGMWEPSRVEAARITGERYPAKPYPGEEWFECILDFPIVPSIGDSIPMGRDSQPVMIEGRVINPQPGADLCVSIYLGSFTGGDRDHVAALFEGS